MTFCSWIYIGGWNPHEGGTLLQAEEYSNRTARTIRTDRVIEVFIFACYFLAHRLVVFTSSGAVSLVCWTVRCIIYFCETLNGTLHNDLRSGRIVIIPIWTEMHCWWSVRIDILCDTLHMRTYGSCSVVQQSTGIDVRSWRENCDSNCDLKWQQSTRNLQTFVMRLQCGSIQCPGFVQEKTTNEPPGRQEFWLRSSVLFTIFPVDGTRETKLLHCFPPKGSLAVALNQTSFKLSAKYQPSRSLLWEQGSPILQTDPVDFCACRASVACVLRVFLWVISSMRETTGHDSRLHSQQWQLPVTPPGIRCDFHRKPGFVPEHRPQTYLQKRTRRIKPFHWRNVRRLWDITNSARKKKKMHRPAYTSPLWNSMCSIPASCVQPVYWFIFQPFFSRIRTAHVSINSSESHSWSSLPCQFSQNNLSKNGRNCRSTGRW